MKVVLYVLPGSHPSMAGRLMLEHKQVAYERVDLVPAVHRLVLRWKGFPGITVPSVDIDGTKITGTRNIARELDRRFPERPLFPAAKAQRALVEEAEDWGDQLLQPVPRRITWWCIKRDASCSQGFLDGAKLPLPSWMVAPATPVVARLAARRNGATDEALARDLASLPGQLDKVDGLIARGVIGGEACNAADFQIAPSIRLLMTLDDLAPLMEGRPLAAWARRIVPSYPGRITPILPPELLRRPAA